MFFLGTLSFHLTYYGPSIIGSDWHLYNKLCMLILVDLSLGMDSYRQSNMSMDGNTSCCLLVAEGFFN